MLNKILLLLCLTLAARAEDPILPNPKLTPGGVVTNIPVETILAHGYTASTINGAKVRTVPLSVHRKVFIQYFGKIPDHPGDYEVDHLVSLELGGCNDIYNLWPQSYKGYWNARMKDTLENKLASLAREELRTNGHNAAVIKLTQFQHEIATNWTNTYHKYIK